MRFSHEKNYYERIQQGQIDIDSLLLERFMCPGDVVLDAGANIGYTALQCLAAGAREVYAFEPVPALYQRLKTLSDSVIHTFNTALSDRDGEAEILLSQVHNQGHSLQPKFLEMFPKVYGDQLQRQSVRLARLDTICTGIHFDFLKIDVEGSELDLLRGAETLLRESPPRVIQVECYDQMFPDLHALACRYFAYCRRVALECGTQHLRLAEPFDTDILNTVRYNALPPVYIYTNDVSLLSEI
jgi:FkbM family methyltransferase